MRKKKGGGEGGANWMDTYGDMVTLLLCFFVLLYSISTISEENWKALVLSFNPDAAVTPTETSGDEGPNADTDGQGGDPNAGTTPGEMTQEQVDIDIEELFQQLKSYVSQEGAQSTISVTKGDGQVFISFNQAIFFDGDKSYLREESKPILDTVGGMLEDASRSIDEIRIQGHTAQALDIPNNVRNDRFLAVDRATEVLVYLQENTELDPARMVSEGFGQWRPKAPNDTEENKAKNRRVEMIISGRDIEQELADSIEQYHSS